MDIISTPMVLFVNDQTNSPGEKKVVLVEIKRLDSTEYIFSQIFLIAHPCKRRIVARFFGGLWVNMPDTFTRVYKHYGDGHEPQVSSQ